jgi:murein DD-endopeptidase MepM/ murein hydrolase activator NlpD
MLKKLKREENEQPVPSVAPSLKVRSGKLLLLLGLGLAALIVLETRQQVVEALDLKDLPTVFSLPSSPPSNPMPASPPISDRPQASSQTSTQPKQAEPQQVSLAINIGEGGEEPNVAAVDPRQMRIPQWQGASFPVENFQAYTSAFGYRLSATGGYSQEFHYGLDIASPEGSYIRNWWSGVVVEVSDDSNCGTSVVVESGNWLHIYCHMQGHVETANGKRYMIDRSGGVQIWEGQQINAGTRIGRVGMTGRTTGPHLHWGLKYDNNWVDPALVLQAMYAEQQNAGR